MPIALSSIKAKVKTDATGSTIEIPAILTPDGILEPLLRYCISRNRDRSIQWMKKLNRAVKLFLEYLSTNPDEKDSYRLFMNFAQRLQTGTIDTATGTDPSGLGWLPMKSKEAHHAITTLTDFFDYLSLTRPAAAKLNPVATGNAYDRMIDNAAYQYKRDQAFLGHTWATTALTSARIVRSSPLLTVEQTDPPAFPEEHFAKLITEGFKVGDRYDYRSMLITLLLHGAGFRESEPFHLFISDVTHDPADNDKALVLIHHPSQGNAPSDWTALNGKQKTGNRAAYLQDRWGLTPRDSLMGSKGAGWKGGAHETKFNSFFFRAYWFAPDFGKLFMVLWRKYLEQVAMVDRKHPYAFINLSRDPIGEPFSLSQYNKAHAAAVKRIGLIPSKNLGTTPHGHRHAYGRRLKNAEVDEELIRRFMHHSSINSQKTYTQPTQSEIFSTLEEAAAKLSLCAAEHLNFPKLLSEASKL